MGFSIGRFLGSIAPTVIGGLIGGPAGAATGAALSAGFGPSVPGRAASPPAAAPVNIFAQVPPLSSTVPTPSRISFAGLPSTTSLAGAFGRSFGRSGTALQLFGSGGNGGRGNRLQVILAEAREATGGPVTRNGIIEAAKVCGLETAAATFGISMEDVCFVVVRGRTRRRRGISAADIRRTKRTIRFVKGLRKDLVAVKGR